MAGPGGPIDTQLSAIGRSLLVALARSRRPFSREELAARWWPEAEPQRARASLSTLLWAIRSALRDALRGDPLATTRDRVALDPALAVELDVERFEGAIGRGEDAAAEDWYGGPYLRGVFDDDVVAERERLAGLYERTLARLLHDDPDAERALRLVAVDPYADVAYRVLVDASLADGSASAARAWLRRARAAFAEIGLTPPFFALPHYAPLVAAIDERVRRTNLSSEVTSFVGRAVDLRAVDRALNEERIVTLLGTGGSGKTRLAQRVAAHALGTRFPAVWFVELATFEGPGAAGAAISAALDLRDDARTGTDTIVDALRDSDALLVLDNCEHVIDQVSEIVSRVSRGAPLLRILTTSREALRVEGEAVLPIAGLATDDGVTLFLDRARTGDRRLAIDDDAVVHARHIVEALDGMPLAIELAAGRVRIDGLPAIAADAVRAASGAVGPRDREPRSQTIAASIAWSVERLDRAAQILFARLGAFAGGFDASDADALDLTGSNALDRLVDRSLVVRSDPFDATLRLLAPVRADARARLENDARRDDVLDAHAERIRLRALEWHGRRGGERGSFAEARLDALAADTDLALERLFARGRADDAIDLVTKLGSHWTVRGWYAPAERWFLRAEQAVRDDRRRGDLAYARVRFAHDAADVDEQLRLGEIARRAYERAGDIGGQARACNVIGSGLLNAMRVEEARTMLTRSLALQREIGDAYGIAVVLCNLGVVSATLGDYHGALAAYEEADPILNRLATIQPRIKIQNNIAFVRMWMGDDEASRRATERALELAEASENEAMIAFAASNAAGRYARLGNFDAAVDLARRVGELADPPPAYVGIALIARAAAARAAGEEKRSRRFAAAARVVEREHGAFEPTESEMLATLPGAADEAVDGDLRAARALLAT